MTFRCSENDIFVDEKLLKPYGRLWVGNLVVSSWTPTAARPWHEVAFFAF